MKALELIEKLSKCNPDTEVYIRQEDHYYTHLKAYSVKEATMPVENDDGIIDDDIDVIIIDYC